MTRDASLEEFVGGESNGESEVSDSEGGDSTVESEEAESEVEESVVEQDESEVGNDNGCGEAVSPASATYVWTPAGDACARCGSSVERMWRCEGELVCGECKEW